MHLCKTVRYVFTMQHSITMKGELHLGVQGVYCISLYCAVCALVSRGVYINAPQWPSYRFAPVTLFVALRVDLFKCQTY